MQCRLTQSSFFVLLVKQWAQIQCSWVLCNCFLYYPLLATAGQI
jgi:hypothetical protein